MAEQGKNVRGRLDPLPQLKPYEPFAYNAFDLPDPFKPRKIQPGRGDNKLAPDLNRRREPLEPIRSSRSRWSGRWREPSRCMRW